MLQPAGGPVAYTQMTGDDISRANARLEAIEALLNDLARSSIAHGHFALLYFHTVSRWRAYSRTCRQNEALDLLIIGLFDKFDDYVLRLPRERKPTSIRPWAGYLRRMSVASPGWLSRISALALAVRAHIRFDLAEAICEMHEVYSRRHGAPPDMAQFQKTILDASTALVFLAAWEDFVSGLANQGRFAGTVAVIARPLGRIGLPAFQAMRRRAMHEALDSLRTARRIERPLVYVRLGRALV